jgi:uncharacterized protein (TIGR01777 family)
LVDETAAPGTDFLAKLCIDWETEALAASDLGVRVVLLRTGLVIHDTASAFQKLEKLFRMALGGPLGSGQQWMSWIHLEDLVRLIQHAAGKEGVAGALNACTPEPIRNTEFTREMSRAASLPRHCSPPSAPFRAQP